jgi:hypothetical protein
MGNSYVPGCVVLRSSPEPITRIYYSQQVVLSLQFLTLCLSYAAAAKGDRWRAQLQAIFTRSRAGG